MFIVVNQIAVALHRTRQPDQRHIEPSQANVHRQGAVHLQPRAGSVLAGNVQLARLPVREEVAGWANANKKKDFLVLVEKKP